MLIEYRGMDRKKNPLHDSGLCCEKMHQVDS